MTGNWFRNLVAGRPQALLEQMISLEGSTCRILERDREYVRVRLNTLKLAHGRKGTYKYFGCVYSEFRAVDLRLGEAVYHRVTIPDYLKGIDESSLDRVLVKDIILLDTIPYRGDLSFQLGLFSIPTVDGDLVGPYLEFLTDVADQTGVGPMAKTALGYVQPLQKGFDLLCGAHKGIRLEVGIDKSFENVSTGTHVLCRGDLSSRRPLKLSESGALLDAKRNTIDGIPYVIYSIEATKRNSRWKIHEVKEAHDALMILARMGETKIIRERALPHFQEVLRASPDLISEDAELLGEEEERRYSGPPGERRQDSHGEFVPWTLDDLESAVDVLKADQGIGAATARRADQPPV